MQSLFSTFISKIFIFLGVLLNLIIPHGASVANTMSSDELLTPPKFTTTSIFKTIIPTVRRDTQNSPTYPASVDVLNLKVSIINIICVSKTPELPSISASGVIIDQRGVILTNAHVAQYFLLTDYIKRGLLECVIRGGNPAKTRYGAELLYIPAKWVENGAISLGNQKAIGTGEDDFALLRIYKTAEGSSLTTELPFLKYSTTTKFYKDEAVVAAAYPAEFISKSDISNNLYNHSVIVKIRELLTFKSSTIDLLRIKGSTLAQRGSSGGAVVNLDGSLIGIIATASDTFYDNERDLYIITMSYIDREIERDTGKGLNILLSGNISRKAINFSLHGEPYLRKIIEKNLTQN